jgi:hypothetical protein
MNRTIAEDIRAGTSTGGRIIIGHHGVLPSADPATPESLTPEQEKTREEMRAQLENDHAYIAAQDRFAQDELARGIGKHYAYMVQEKIRGLGNNEAGRKIGLSHHAVARLRVRAPFDVVSIDFPRP